MRRRPSPRSAGRASRPSPVPVRRGHRQQRHQHGATALPWRTTRSISGDAAFHGQRLSSSVARATRRSTSARISGVGLGGAADWLSARMPAAHARSLAHRPDTDRGGLRACHVRLQATPGSILLCRATIHRARIPRTPALHRQIPKQIVSFRNRISHAVRNQPPCHVTHRTFLWTTICSQVPPVSRVHSR
jgi:hypothetical protein